MIGKHVSSAIVYPMIKIHRFIDPFSNSRIKINPNYEFIIKLHGIISTTKLRLRLKTLTLKPNFETNHC